VTAESTTHALFLHQDTFDTITMLVHWHHSNELERHSLERMYLPPTKLFPRLAVNKTILKSRVTAGFSRRNKIPRCSVYNIRESNPVRHPDYNPDWAQKLISSSISRHLSTHNISSKSMHTFFSNVDNRQTDRQTRANAFTSSFVRGKNTNLLSDAEADRDSLLLELGHPNIHQLQCENKHKQTRTY